MIKFINKDNALEIQNLKKWLLSKKVVAIDSETRSVDFNNAHTTEMIMFQIGDKETQWVIDTRDISIALLKHYLESKNLLKIGHNIKYDYKVLLNYDITLENVWDTMVVEQVLTNSGNREKGYYSLEQTHYRYYDVNPYGDQLSLFDPYIPKSERNKISKKEEEPFEESEIYYGATDIITCYKVYDKQSSIIELEDMYELAELENEFTLVLGDCEYNGIPLNKERWVELAEWTDNKQSELLAELNNAYPDIKNWNSHVQVKDLFRSLGMNITKSIKGEIKESIQTIHLVKYIEEYPILKTYLKYKEFAKLSSTYGLSFLRNINPTTNRIHSNFIQILNTGRTASSSPNLQNIKSATPDFPEGKWWREAFACEGDRTFVIADYSSQELNIAAHKSQDVNMLTALRNGEDLHRLAASGLYGKEASSITPEERKNGKIANFSILYGAGEDKIAEFFKCSKSKAKELLAGYFSKFPLLEHFQKNSFDNSITNGYILIDSLNRRYYIPEIEEYRALTKMCLDQNVNPEYKKRLKALKGKIFRDSANYPIQGEAASMSKYAGVLLRRKSKEYNFKVILLIHDEWILECASNDGERTKKILEQCMGEAAKKFCASVEIRCDAHITKTWSK